MFWYVYRELHQYTTLRCCYVKKKTVTLIETEQSQLRISIANHVEIENRFQVTKILVFKKIIEQRQHLKNNLENVLKLETKPNDSKIRKPKRK